MKRIAFHLLAITLLTASCKSQQKSTNMSADQITTVQGWQPLFDGKTTNGWHTYGQPDVGAAWNVQDGALHLQAGREGNAGGGDLVTNQEYGDYHLKLEWKISKNGNSGVIFYIHEDKAKYPQTYNTGLELQVIDNDGHADAKINKHRAGDLYDLVACSTETVKPVGEWNLSEIISKNGKLEFMLNGTKVVSTTLWNDDWRNMVANSKFKTMPGFGTYKTGKISLQDHGNEVWYRNIMIKPL